MATVSLIQKLSNYLGYDYTTTESLMRKADNTYRRYYIKKSNGTQRAILHPSSVTKSIQYGLIELFLLKFPINLECAMAYVKNNRSPLLKNATIHSKYKYSVRIDFKEFFPSIRPNDLIDRAKKLGFDIPDRTPELLKTALFVPKYMAVQSYSADGGRVRKRSGSSEYGLAIGAPASPIISNIVMYEIDNEIIKYTKQNEASYTRYSDDIIYSSSVKGECVKFVAFLETLLSQIQSPKLEINKEKTIFMSQGTRKTVTGLTICPDGRISLGRKKKRLVSAMVHRAMKKKLPTEGKSYLRGYLSFILSVEPDFYDRLILKYGGEIIKQLHYS